MLLGDDSVVLDVWTVDDVVELVVWDPLVVDCGVGVGVSVGVVGDGVLLAFTGVVRGGGVLLDVGLADVELGLVGEIGLVNPSQISDGNGVQQELPYLLLA